ncbi:hypothetical protein PR048_019027 [Dryococelus australis]|uniref:HTH psq-type domain-containing protein n=1 Tax=Dryococelus australis TaxID=614101 RepID=A0ABQ9H2D1_9NEOP|nr:hypothetical protein PR048_019027 [Dryococelus australis]
MPNCYQRKSDRARWPEGTLEEAVSRGEAGDIGKREAEKYYRIPARTISRRIERNYCTRRGLGPEGKLGTENEKRFVRHIQNLSNVRFAPDRQTVRVLTYKFAENFNVQHKLSKKSEMAGYAWLNSSLNRSPELTIRQAEGLSVARVIEEHNLMDKPGHIFNVDESGFPLINRPGKVLTNNGSRSVHTTIPKERGENITLIDSFNAEGQYLSPVVITKDVYMNPKYSNISAEWFPRWFVKHFVPRKPTCKTVLIIGGHASHILSPSDNLERLKDKKRSKPIPASPETKQPRASSKGVKRRKTSHKGGLVSVQHVCKVAS